MGSFFSTLAAVGLAVLLLSVVGVAFLAVGALFAVAIGAYKIRELVTS
ncbi:hypothetical protein [Salininema proteolyticum]|uniref:Uncharacterized protein n=1 Tax=Salininema proteolyticum TaxID=1607685 RepID=A0ABV8U3Z0_9ACTN